MQNFAWCQPPAKQTVFGIGLFTSSHSQLVTYAIVTLRNGVPIGAQVVSEQQFMYQAMGYYPSIANLSKENLFEKHGVDSCFLLYNEYSKIVGYYAKPFQDLWKIRFYEHPFLFDTPGWSQGRIKPSLYQTQFIYEQYGVKNILTDYFYGDTLYKLLRDVQNPEWIINYKFASADSSDTTTNNGNQ